MVELDEIIKGLAETYGFDENDIWYLYSKLLEYPIFEKADDLLKNDCLEILIQKLGEWDVNCNLDECLDYSINYIFDDQGPIMSLK